MNETLTRQWKLLQAIPRAPERMSTLQFQEILDEKVTLRTLQRDLQYLKDQGFPVECDNSKPMGWSWKKEAELLYLPGMDPHTALTFKLVEGHLKRLIPPTTAKLLEPWFKDATSAINKNGSSVFNWNNKIRVISRSMRTEPQEINPQVQSVVYNCLLKGEQIEVTYDAITHDAPPKTYPIHPLALVVNEESVYLLCTARDRQEVTTLAMHRIVKAVAMDLPIRIPLDFDIDKSANLAFKISLSKEKMHIRIKVRNLAAKYLVERSLSKDQTIERIDENWSLVTATVDDTQHLKTWLLSLGQEVVVESPLALREFITREIMTIMNQYDELGVRQ